jgi:hypothetical protein
VGVAAAVLTASTGGWLSVALVPFGLLRPKRQETGWASAAGVVARAWPQKPKRSHRQRQPLRLMLGLTYQIAQRQAACYSRLLEITQLYAELDD